MSQFPESLSALEADIRRSVLSDRYGATPALLARYVREVEARLHIAPEELPTLQARVADLFEWVGQLVQSSRQELLGSVSHLHQLSGYDNPPSPTHVQADA